MCSLGLFGDDVPPCAVCPVVGGPMKPAVNGEWVHLTCATWIPELGVGDMDTMWDIKGLDMVGGGD